MVLKHKLPLSDELPTESVWNIPGMSCSCSDIAVVKPHGSSMVDKKGGTKKRGKRVHWVICGEYIGFDKAPWLCVQVEIHIRGLSV